MDENRHRHTVWMDDDVWDQVESHYQRDNCTTKNEFIEKAIRFYSGYLDTESADAYLPRVLADVLEGKLGALGNRTSASFTLDTYTHVTPDMQQEASHIVGGFLEDLLGKDLKPWQKHRPEGGAYHG